MAILAQFILASQSPRRKDLLTQLGYKFDCQPADIDESVIDGESASDYVKRLALAKAQRVAVAQIPSTIVVGSDTCVVFEQHLLGKPENLAQCREYLSMLSGQQHQVLTAVAVVQGELSEVRVVSTSVRFKTLSDAEIVRYWQSGEPQDKAGGYGIQGIGAQFVTGIDGCYFAVMGLPLYETSQLLTKFGVYNPINAVK